MAGCIQPSLAYPQVDKGSTKEETEDPKTIDKFTDRFTTQQGLIDPTYKPLVVLYYYSTVSWYKKHGITKIIVFSVYMDALKDHVITNAANGKTICVKKHNFPDTGTQWVIVLFCNES